MLPAARRMAAGLLLAAGASIANAASASDAAGGVGSIEPTSSPIETAYSDRAGLPLRLHGRDLFLDMRDVGPSNPGALQDDQVIGLGDELSVTLRGQRSYSRRVAVDEAGQIVLDDLRPLTAAGRTLRELRAELEAEV